MKTMEPKYAIIDSQGVISDGFDTEDEAMEDYGKLCGEYFEFHGIVMIVLIVNRLT